MEGPSPTISPTPNNPIEDIWPSAPAWIVAVVASGVALAVLVAALKPLALSFHMLIKNLAKLIRLRTREEKFRLERCRSFARFVITQLELLSAKEDWHDQRFAELAADVEMEGRIKILRWLSRSPTRTVALRRERSLTRAIRRSTEPIIILEGDPGSGKSVALRHVAQVLAQRAKSRHRREIAAIPLYINLKEFKPKTRPVRSEDIREFALSRFKRVHDRDVDEFLDDEFDRGLREGFWVILFDSFDEIPDILSATESNQVIEEYADALHNFLIGMKKCRGVIASREFRGPRSFRVPRFRVAPLTRRRQRDLVRRSGLTPEKQDIVMAGLAAADSEFDQMALNPMYLGLVCEHARETGVFTSTSYLVHKTYMEQRFARDADRIMQRYGIKIETVRAVAEEAAFCMAAVRGLGLSPNRKSLQQAILRQKRLSGSRLMIGLDALEYTKLARGEGDIDDSSRVFTFAHRRFQEYFATCVVLRDRKRVPIRKLLTEGQWRETAVTILQTQTNEAVSPILKKISEMLEEFASQLHGSREVRSVWPSGSLHLISLCNAGLGHSPESLILAARSAIAEILIYAWENGRRYDRKWVIELAVVADRETTLTLVENAFISGESAVRGAAYEAVGHLAHPPARLYRNVRIALMDMAKSRRLRENRHAINAQIRRLPEPGDFLNVVRLLRWHTLVDTLLLTSLIILQWVAYNSYQSASLSKDPAIGAGIVFPVLAVAIVIMTSRSRLHLEAFDNAKLLNLTLLIMRCMGVMMLTLNVEVQNSQFLIAGIVMGAALIVWPLAVRHACMHGCVGTIATWPLLPFKLFHVLPGGIITIKRGAGFVRQRIFGILGYGIILGIVVTSTFYLIKNHYDESWWFIIFWSAIFCLMAAFIIPTTLRDAIENGYDKRNDKRVLGEIAEDVEEVSWGEFISTFDKLATAKGTSGFVVASIRRGVDGSVIDFLDDIAETIEINRRSPGYSLRVSDPSPLFEQWLIRHRNLFPYRVGTLSEVAIASITDVVEDAKLGRGAAR